MAAVGGTTDPSHSTLVRALTAIAGLLLLAVGISRYRKEKEQGGRKALQALTVLVVAVGLMAMPYIMQALVNAMFGNHRRA